ncbi:MAG: hypothetical protein LBF43_00620 [Puniceicoccales bacterium]|jgi:ribonuclease PH|nr:hypothetical protein [Puniceicoccales bacterium]
MSCPALAAEGKLKANPFTNGVAAVGIGIRDGQVRLDLNYAKDSRAKVDLNVVMSGQGYFIEIQGTAEKHLLKRSTQCFALWYA